MNHHTCSKCLGLLVTETVHDHHAWLSCRLAYCINCGLRTDAVIGLNRTHRPPAIDGRTLPRMVGAPQAARV